MDFPVAIIGAGPYGLATAAFLRSSGVPHVVLGEPMESWRTAMPEGMKLRSRRRSSHLADPKREFSIDAWERSAGRRAVDPIPVEDFIDYGRWFFEHAVERSDPRKVAALEPSAAGFRLRLDDGDELSAGAAVVATGIGPFAHRPPPLGDLPAELVSHSLDHGSLRSFAGKRVLVVGAGQSALESAALLDEAGAAVTVAARADDIVWLADDELQTIKTRLNLAIRPPTDVGGRVSGWLAATPDVFRRLSPERQAWVMSRCLVPAGAAWIRPRFGDVRLETSTEVVGAESDGDAVTVELADGTAREFDRVMLCTGYRVDVERYGFLSDQILDRLERIGGAPRLGPGYESSIEGLHFVGATAAPGFGPLMRFVVGTWYAAPTVAGQLAGNRRRALRLSFPTRRVPRGRGLARADG